MFKFPEGFSDGGHGIPGYWESESERDVVHTFYNSKVGAGDIDHEKLEDAVFCACECIDEHEKNDFYVCPIVISAYTMENGFGSFEKEIKRAETVEEFYEWIHDYFKI